WSAKWWARCWMWGAADLDRKTLTVSMKARTAPRPGRPCRPKGWSWWKCNTKRPGESGSPKGLLTLERYGGTLSLRQKSVRIPIMAATAIPIDTLPSINPATGEVLGHFERTPASSLPEIVSRGRLAQRDWAKLPIRDRCVKLCGLRDRIMASRNELTDAVVRESGKPRVEALFADIFVTLDSAEYWSKNAARA